VQGPGDAQLFDGIAGEIPGEGCLRIAITNAGFLRSKESSDLLLNPKPFSKVFRRKNCAVRRIENYFFLE
jgi:hypothetical protein